MEVTGILHNSTNRGINYHMFENKGNYMIIPIYDVMVVSQGITLLALTATFNK